MSLGVPLKVQKVEGNVATAEIKSVRRRIHLDILDEKVGAGDYVIVHAGFAIRKLPNREAKATLTLLSDVGVLSAAQTPGP
jgi:hydrogenase expression/formation protein HypC